MGDTLDYLESMEENGFFDGEFFIDIDGMNEE